MAVSQKLTLTQLENQGGNYQVGVLWTSTQTGPSYNNVARTAYLYYSINGGEENAVAVQYALPVRTEKVILNITIDVPPVENGTAKLSVRTWMDTRISAGVVTLTEELELRPVASTITAEDAFIGSSTLVKIHSSNVEHTHSIRYSFGAQTGYLTEDGGVSETKVTLASNEVLFAVPESFYEEIPDSVYGTVDLLCTTYAGNNQIGEPQQASFNVLVDDGICSPFIGGTVKDANNTTLALTGDENTLIRYHSTARCTITPEAQCSATIKTKWINGIEVTDDALELPNIEQDQVVFKIEDSRGFQAETVNQLDLIPYRHLSLAASIERDDPTSGNATLQYSGVFYRGSFGAVNNDLTFEYKIGSGEYQTADIDHTVNLDRYTAVLNLSGLEYNRVYTIIARVSDKLETVEKKLTLKKGVPVFDWGENDFKFNVPVNVDAQLDVKSLTIGGVPLYHYFFPIGSVFITYNLETDPNEYFGGAWEQVFTGQTNDGIRWKRVG